MKGALTLTRLRTLLFTPAGIRAGLGPVGLVAAAAATSLQVLAAIYPRSVAERWWLILIGLGCSLIVGLAISWPRIPMRVRLNHGRVCITIKIGDILNERNDFVVGFSDTFDTDTSSDRVIDPASLQGQFLARCYDNNCEALDRDLDLALTTATPLSIEDRSSKERGKLRRYPIGTVAVLRVNERNVYCVAYSAMTNNLVARSDVSLLWASMAGLWSAVGLHGQRAVLSIPLMGGSLARIDTLNREALLKFILLSYVAWSSRDIVSGELVLVISPRDAQYLNFLELRSFVRAL